MTNRVQKTTVKELILWWEKKRLIYNIVIIGFTVFLNYSFWNYPMRSIIGDNQVILNAIVFVLVVNLFYTLGWGLGVLRYFLLKTKGLNNTGRWVLFVLGTLFSLFIADLYFVFEFDVLFSN